MSDDYTQHVKSQIVLEYSALGLGHRKQGKVRDIYDIGDHMILVTTDRVSAFDRVLASIPYKGQVLNQVSVWWFKNTEHILPNHLVEVSDPIAVIARKCKPFPIELVVRGYITGTTDTSMWTNYAKGVRNYCGHILPEGLKQNQKLEKNLVTPTTKEEVHDRLISPEEIVKENLMTQEEWDYCSAKALELFEYGQMVAQKRGLLLVDTKYEMGRTQNGQIILIDEIHTPDSSRYWLASSYQERYMKGQTPETIDKDILRRWYLSNSQPYKDPVLPKPPWDLVELMSLRYIQLYEIITGLKFDFHVSEGQGCIHERLERNIMKSPLVTHVHIKKVILLLETEEDKIISSPLIQLLQKNGISFLEYVIFFRKNKSQKANELVQYYEDLQKQRHSHVVFVTISSKGPNELGEFVGSLGRVPTVMYIHGGQGSEVRPTTPQAPPVFTVLDPEHCLDVVQHILNNGDIMSKL